MECMKNLIETVIFSDVFRVENLYNRYIKSAVTFERLVKLTDYMLEGQSKGDYL